MGFSKGATVTGGIFNSQRLLTRQVMELLTPASLTSLFREAWGKKLKSLEATDDQKHGGKTPGGKWHCITSLP